MSRFLYSTLFYLAVPLVLLRVYWRAIKEPRYRADLAQRFGFCPPLSGTDLVWVHAVSAGETIAAVPLIKAIVATGRQVLVTNMTPTGRAQAERLLAEQLASHAVVNCYVPYDLPGAVARFLRRSRPKALVIIDTELWPNLIHGAHQAGVRVLLLNARLSARSAAGYGRIANLTQGMLQDLDVVGVQSAAQGQRFIELGLPPTRLHLTGSIKFDASQPQDMAQRLAEFRQLLGQRLVVVAGSTHPGEEQQLLDALQPLQQRHPEILLVLAPRHHYRAPQVLQLCQEQGLQTQLRSLNSPCTANHQVYVVDTMGELFYLYACADITFVGGSLVPVGGHNPMEPASLGKPVIMGQYLRNIEDVADLFIEQGGLLRVDSAAGLGEALALLCGSAEQRSKAGAAALQTVAANRGALAASLALLEATLRA